MSAATPLAMRGFLLRDLRAGLAMRPLQVLCACLFLGIFLISACAGLLELVRGGLAAQERQLFGGDVRVNAREALSSDALGWLQARGEVSRLTELRTMLGTADGAFTVVELQSVDAAYPLYGRVRLAPDLALGEAVAPLPDGSWGAAFDPVLAERLELSVGDRVAVGEIELTLRALVVEQPDRSFRADWRGPPVIVAGGALEASGLTGPSSRVDIEYRVRTDADPDAWRASLLAAFPDAGWEVDTVGERGELVAERLDEVASVLLLVGFATLLIGGLGVANSVAAYLDAKRRTLATLRALGARGAQVAFVFIGQTLLLALAASAAGALAGSGVAWFASRALAERLPLAASAADLAVPALAATGFGVLAALAFALPALGRALGTRPAPLLREIADAGAAVPRGYRVVTLALLALLVVLLVTFVPEPLAGLAFVVAVALLLLALEGLVRLLRHAARTIGARDWLDGRFAARTALAGLHRPGNALRPMLLSLGTSLTLLVAATVVVTGLLRTLADTVPERAPALVLYDIPDTRLDELTALANGLDGFEALETTPLVLGRLRAVDGVPLGANEDARRALEANDEQKLGRRNPGIDRISVERGAWWPDDYAGPPLVAFEDREADQAGLVVGDRLTFALPGGEIEAELAAIYSQASFETSFWFEAVFSEGVLAPWITRHVGSVFLAPGHDVAALNAIAADFPEVVTLRTARALEAARAVLAAAALAVITVAAVALAASVLVMASVVAVNRQRQAHEASVLHAIGTRRSVILASVRHEHALLGTVLSVFASVVGGALGLAVLRYRLELPDGALGGGAWLAGPGVAATASALCLGAGAWWLSRTLAASPATLLRRSE